MIFGIVEETGTAAVEYNKDDEVFGIADVFKREALSEYIIVEEKEISIKSQNIFFEQATAIPVLASAA